MLASTRGEERNEAAWSAERTLQSFLTPAHSRTQTEVLGHILDLYWLHEKQTACGWEEERHAKERDAAHACAVRQHSGAEGRK